MRAVLIYFLKDPTNPKKGYVGQTACWKTRFGDHIKEARSGRKNYYCCNWIRSLLKKGLKPEFEHLAQVPEVGWEQHEIAYIAAFKSMGYALTNTTLGGEGCGNGKDHPSFGKPGPRRGVPVTPETRAKMSRAKQGEKHPMFGKQRPPEVCEKIRIKNLGKKHTPETCAKLVAINLERTFTSETKQKMSQSRLLFLQDQATFYDYLLNK